MRKHCGELLLDGDNLSHRCDRRRGHRGWHRLTTPLWRVRWKQAKCADLGTLTIDIASIWSPELFKRFSSDAVWRRMIDDA